MVTRTTGTDLDLITEQADRTTEGYASYGFYTAICLVGNVEKESQRLTCTATWRVADHSKPSTL